MPERIQRKRAKGWKLPDNTRIVSRPTIWGNWIACGKHGKFDITHTYDGELRVRVQMALNKEVSPSLAKEAYSYWLRYPHTPIEFLPGLEFLENYDRGNGIPLAVRKTANDLRDTVLNSIWRLRDLNLACWCPLDQPCHADVLLEIANT